MKIYGALRLGWRILRGGPGEELARYSFAERVTSWIYPTYQFSEFGRSHLRDEEFLRIYRRFEGKNTKSFDRKFVLDQFARLANDVPGDTAECGVFRGGSSYLICRRTAGSGKTHHLFDSFEGLSAPGGEDGAYWKPGDLSAGMDEVRKNLEGVEKLEFHPGWIPERFGDVADATFSFVHIDVDLYQPTLDSLEFFVPRLATGGVLICDDYGFESCPGARKAMDEYFEERQEPVLHLPTGQGVVFARPGG